MFCISPHIYYFTENRLRTPTTSPWKTKIFLRTPTWIYFISVNASPHPLIDYFCNVRIWSSIMSTTDELWNITLPKIDIRLWNFKLLNYLNICFIYFFFVVFFFIGNLKKYALNFMHWFNFFISSAYNRKFRACSFIYLWFCCFSLFFSSLGFPELRLGNTLCIFGIPFDLFRGHGKLSRWLSSLQWRWP